MRWRPAARVSLLIYSQIMAFRNSERAQLRGNSRTTLHKGKQKETKQIKHAGLVSSASEKNKSTRMAARDRRAIRRPTQRCATTLRCCTCFRATLSHTQTPLMQRGPRSKNNKSSERRSRAFPERARFRLGARKHGTRRHSAPKANRPCRADSAHGPTPLPRFQSPSRAREPAAPVSDPPLLHPLLSPLALKESAASFALGVAGAHSCFSGGTHARTVVVRGARRRRRHSNLRINRRT